jgi:hypothetical protein
MASHSRGTAFDSSLAGFAAKKEPSAICRNQEFGRKRTALSVVPGLVPGIHAVERCEVSRLIFRREFLSDSALAGVDARDKHGHDAGCALHDAPPKGASI